MIDRWVIVMINGEMGEECFFCRYSTASHCCTIASGTDYQRKIAVIRQRNFETTSSTVRILHSLWEYHMKFRSWTEATLDVTVRWLLRQCGRMETESRRKCIELVCTFIPLLPGMYTSQSSNQNLMPFSKVFVPFENISIWKWKRKRTSILSKGNDLENLYGCCDRICICRFEGTVGNEKKTRFKANLANHACLTDLNELFSLPLIHQWLDTVIASLDCYTWVFSQGFLNPLLLQGGFLISI